jgi:hypothetical protein
MQYFISDFLRPGALASALIGMALCSSPASAQSIELQITPLGSAAAERSLPVGARPAVKISVRNSGKKTIGPVVLSLRSEFTADKAAGWTL